jgi:D-beta-D-heptose 7-phosphate kinase/D-beta-D-heptose 1-phosphate adenosyltransferase
MKLDAGDFRRSRVLLIGDVMLDRYWSGGTDRISPEAPVPVVGLKEFRDLPGGAANVALNVASLGTRCTLLGLTGSDDAGTRLRKALESTTIDSRLVATDSSPTITKLRVLSRNQHLMRLDIEDGFADSDHAALVAAYREALDECDLVVLSDYAKGTLGPVTAELIAAAKEAGLPVLVDPKGADFARYRGADLVTPNRGEFERVVGACADDETLEARARDLIRDLDLGAILVTRSEQGMSLVPRDGEAVHLPAHRREVYDVTGAGDTVIGVMAAALAAGHPLADALVLANHAAAIVVGHLGAAQVTLDELHDAIAGEGRSADPGGVVEPDELVSRLQAARRRGESIVFTNGCFDLLHVGHVRGLRAMRALGDRLVVGVNDDDSVRRLKGDTRPLVPLAERMELLAALDCVDYVVAFGEDTPAELIETVQPDVLAKGGDYAPADIVGHDSVTARGGRVAVIDYVDGRSTTGLIGRIRGDD